MAGVQDGLRPWDRPQPRGGVGDRLGRRFHRQPLAAARIRTPPVVRRISATRRTTRSIAAPANSGLGDCGTPTPQGATGTWEPITHTYPGPGTYTACVSIYDVHYKNVDRTKLSAAITGPDDVQTSPMGRPWRSVTFCLIDKRADARHRGDWQHRSPSPAGSNGTAVANHKKDTVVKEIVPSDPKQLVAGSNAAKYGTGDHNADNSVETDKKNRLFSLTHYQCLPVTFRV